jgi:hypothetical protein
MDYSNTTKEYPYKSKESPLFYKNRGDILILSGRQQANVSQICCDLYYKSEKD